MYKRQLEELYKKFREEDQQIEVKCILLPAISMLYLLGLLTYHEKTDSFEYVGEHAT